MALVLTKVWFSGDYRYANNGTEAEGIFDAAWDNSYPTGGEVMNVSAYFASVHSVENVPGDTAAHGGVGHANPVGHNQGTAAAGQLLHFAEDGVSGIVAQTADMTDISAITAQRLRIKGPILATYSA